MVMFCLMTRRKINLVRLILDLILITIHAERKRLATLPYDMFLTRVFIRAQLAIDGHETDHKRPTTTMKTFLALRLKPQEKVKEKDKEKEKEKKDKKKKDSSDKKISATKHTSKPSEEGNKKKRTKRSLSSMSKERRASKRRLLKLIEDLSSEDEASTIAVDLVNAAALATRLAARASRPAQRGILIKEPVLQEQPAEKEVSNRKGS